MPCCVLCALFVDPQVSVSMIGGGWVYCSKNMESTSVKCDLKKCDVTELKSGVTTTLTIPVRKGWRSMLVLMVAARRISRSFVGEGGFRPKDIQTRVLLLGPLP